MEKSISEEESLTEQLSFQRSEGLICPHVAEMELFPFRHVKEELQQSQTIPETPTGTTRGLSCLSRKQMKD